MSKYWKIMKFAITISFRIFCTFWAMCQTKTSWRFLCSYACFLKKIGNLDWNLTYFFSNVSANIFRDIFALLNSLLCDECSVDCFVVSFTFSMGLLLMVWVMSLIVSIPKDLKWGKNCYKMKIKRIQILSVQWVSRLQ